jgi:dephospho-CoA kinase
MEGAQAGSARPRMLRVALTGGIATGKSYVAKRLVALGIPVIDADSLAHDVMAARTEATAAILARFGAHVAAPDGSIDRTKLGPIVFSDAAARRDLEAIVHPAVYRAIATAIDAFESGGVERIVVVDIPLLFETSTAERFDCVIVTACEPATQVRRLLARGLSEEAAGQRITAQIPVSDKAARADFVIRTDGSYTQTDAQVDAVVEQLRSGCGRLRPPPR